MIIHLISRVLVLLMGLVEILALRPAAPRRHLLNLKSLTLIMRGLLSCLIYFFHVKGRLMV
ncbi:hypothetical protein D3R19_08055 [Salmonella enterica]|nr:hypothetical protein [Salmonella enterica]